MFKTSHNTKSFDAETAAYRPLGLFIEPNWKLPLNRSLRVFCWNIYHMTMRYNSLHKACITNYHSYSFACTKYWNIQFDEMKGEGHTGCKDEKNVQKSSLNRVELKLLNWLAEHEQFVFELVAADVTLCTGSGHDFRHVMILVTTPRKKVAELVLVSIEPLMSGHENAARRLSKTNDCCLVLQRKISKAFVTSQTQTTD